VKFGTEEHILVQFCVQIIVPLISEGVWEWFPIFKKNWGYVCIQLLVLQRRGVA